MIPLGPRNWPRRRESTALQIVGLGFLLCTALLMTHRSSLPPNPQPASLAALPRMNISTPATPLPTQLTPCSACPSTKRQGGCTPTPCECPMCAMLSPSSSSSVNLLGYRNTVFPRYPPVTKSLHRIEGLKLFFVLVGPEARNARGEVRRAMGEWRRDGFLPVEMIGDQEAAALIEGHYPHYKGMFERMMQVHPILAADFLR
jgi:hypothetical protein